MVPTVVELRSSAVAVRYYERDGYYAKNDPEHRQASFWHGEAARALGLRAHVRPSRFESVLSGRVPGTQTRLGRMREGEHEHRPGWDLTFSARHSSRKGAVHRNTGTRTRSRTCNRTPMSILMPIITVSYLCQPVIRTLIA